MSSMGILQMKVQKSGYLLTLTSDSAGSLDARHSALFSAWGLSANRPKRNFTDSYM